MALAISEVLVNENAHPCFDDTARHRFGRIHLPVAAKCNVKCHYCNRRYDCANESRPGVTSSMLTPQQAADYVDELVLRDPTLRVVGIAGPGDPLANPTETLGTLRIIRSRHPDMILCLATNGLALPQWADEIVAVGTSHVTVTVNAIDDEVGAKIYAWVQDLGRTLQGKDAANALWERQRAGITSLVRQDVAVKINCILLPGINEYHVPAIAEEVARLGAIRFNCIPLHPVAGTLFGHFEPPTSDQLSAAQQACERFLPQMKHCMRCRADAVGRLGMPTQTDILVSLKRHSGQSSTEPPALPRRTRVAVASMEGIFVNQHLGEAERFLIFEPGQRGFVFVEERDPPVPSGGMDRWRQLAGQLDDCRVLLVSGVGRTPKRILSVAGLAVHETESLIEDALEGLYRHDRSPKRPERAFKCGDFCKGMGNGCG